MSRRRLAHRALAVAAGLVFDRLAGEPPVQPHPVAAFGRVMRKVEDVIYADSRSAGALHLGSGLAVATVTGMVFGSTALATALTTYVAVAGQALGAAAMEVAAALEAGDVERARDLLPALVGRDPRGLDDKEIARAAVESVAENTVDAVVAPALWALAAGSSGGLGYRAVNTLDAMVGHRSPRYQSYGWASARADDLAGWIPARLTALLVAAVRPASGAEVWRTVRRDARAHPSPNAGVAEAAFAAALGLRLGGVNRYCERIELRPPLGAGRPPEPRDIAPAVRLSRDVGLALAAALAAAGLAGRTVPAREAR
jgi:adenosylcobinamide-phosphate synthase